MLMLQMSRARNVVAGSNATRLGRHGCCGTRGARRHVSAGDCQGAAFAWDRFRPVIHPFDGQADRTTLSLHLLLESSGPRV